MPNKVDRIKAYFGQKPDATYGEIAAACGTTFGYVKNILAGNKSDDVKKQEWSVEKELEGRRENALVKVLQEKLKQTTRQLESKTIDLENALTIKAHTKYEGKKIEWSNSISSEAAALVQFSDWHVGKRIDKKTTNGLNEYNPDIAKKRSETVTKNLLKLIKKERQDIKIPNLVINLGGDAINNFLHEGDAQQNYLSPLEEVRYAKFLIGNSLKTLAEYGDFKKIVLLCQRGNHPRLTKRMQSSVDYKMNLEAMMYWILADDFNDKMFEWHIPESDIGYYEIGQFTIRDFHGHQISYQGGLGGLTIPMNKKVMYWDKTRKAHYNMVSHWHQYQIIGNSISVNSSLCGYDEFAQTNGFAYEPVTQTLQLLDKKRGLTGRFPILAE